jgi:hypothetical protein
VSGEGLLFQLGLYLRTQALKAATHVGHAAAIQTIDF